MRRWILILALSVCSLHAQSDPIGHAEKYIGETEDLGANRSININKWNLAVGAPVGSFWCASFVSAMYKLANYDAPQTPWSPAFFQSQKRLVKVDQVQRNDAVGFYSAEKKRIAHIGLVEKRQGSYIITIEGNTSDSQGIDRNGGGVYRKYRSYALLSNPRHKFSRWEAL